MLQEYMYHSLFGLDAARRQTIEYRLPLLQNLLSHIEQVIPEWIATFQAGDAQTRATLLVRLEKKLGSERWHKELLLPFAEHLSVRSSVEQAPIRRCWRADWFSVVNGKQVKRPTFDAIFEAVRTIVLTHTDHHYRIEEFVKQKLCRDHATAHRVAGALREYSEKTIERGMESLARGVVLAYSEYGPVGLLRSSSHAWTDELFLLERHVHIIARMSPEPHLNMGELRADVLALYEVLNMVNSQLCKQHLLHEVVGSTERRRLQAKLTPAWREQIIPILQQHRACAASDAAVLLDTLFEKGLAGLIDWRCATPAAPAASTFIMQRLEHTLDQGFVALQPWDKQEILHVLEHLQAALEELRIPLSVYQLVHAQLSRSFRQRMSRRFSFGVGATLRRRSHLQKRYVRLSSSKHPKVRKLKQAFPAGQEAQLLAVFARHAGISVEQARRMLRAFITDGVLSLLPLEHRRVALDERLVEDIYLLKLGHLDGAVSWSTLAQRSARYAKDLGVTPLSTQLIMATYKQLNKPRNWHGGEGEITALFSKRMTFTLDALRLHETWTIIPVQLRLPLVDGKGYASGKVCSVLVVLERATERPMGCWVSAGEPTGVEIGLAMYQAIWHPGALQWPLHGIPRTIEIPRALANNDLSNFERAAPYLMTKIEQGPNKYWNTLEVIKHLSQDGHALIQRMVAPKPLTVERVQQAVLSLLMDRWFRRQNCAPVPSQFLKYGVAMPGHRTPAAGWLLPRGTLVETVRNGVRDGANVYSSQHFAVEPGLALQKRAFPYRNLVLKQGLFVEVQGSKKLIFLSQNS